MSQPIKTKGAPKNVKPTSSGNSMMWSPLYFEHVDKLFLDSPTSKSQKNNNSNELTLANDLFTAFIKNQIH